MLRRHWGTRRRQLDGQSSEAARQPLSIASRSRIESTRIDATATPTCHDCSRPPQPCSWKTPFDSRGAAGVCFGRFEWKAVEDV
ncbi:hypothetical protein Dda_8087 [Drechslerella dactyloides]|uniref:Uncharacterized protein n=1 Tax=Drechslerella dactyloides TaxID=74499 RepID=A0AAD6NF75_DREDA|nr:hypothetical protein Dda_8087 [Drechslerella dactyloides]